MKGSLKLLALLLTWLFSWLQMTGQSQYSDYKTMSQKISKLAADYPSLCTVKSIGKTVSGKDIWAISLGSANRDSNPAIAVLAGIDGAYIAGCEIAAGFAEKILSGASDPTIRSILEKTTFYVIPNVSPDATEQYFANLKYERSINAASTDDDRDFETGEDPFEDLNNDGFITQIRVTDPTGTMTESEDDKRIMVQADLSKGQKGTYLVYTEGIDNDKDGSYNEDGPGGVAFNKNFTHNYEEFGMNSGMHAVSEPETKAVADFLYDHFNIYVTFAFGPQDNMGQSQQAAGRPGSMGFGAGQGQSQAQVQQQTQTQTTGTSFMRDMGERRLTSLTRNDETVVKLAADKYREITGIKGSPAVKTGTGNLMDWAYYHYGRYSLGTPGWWISADRGKSAEAAFLKYCEDNKLPDPFVPWTEIKHPDFPGKKVEAGGIKPFAMINPPADKLAELTELNTKFLRALAEMRPELEFLDPGVENLGENIFRVTIKVHNKGLFATCAEAGENNQWTRIMRITAGLSSGQNLLSGQKVQRIQRLEGGKTAEFSWLLSGRGTLKITAGALNTGTITTSLELK
jgi:hypothetical protein